MDIEKLLERGYFPKELPPFFQTTELSKKVKDIINHMNIFNSEPNNSKSIVFSIPKSRNSRRVLNIPNPLHQIRLAKEINDNWDYLEGFYDNSNISLTKPTLDKRNIRAFVPEYSFNEITRQRVIKSTSSRYLLITDISRYYSTIYTHSISWALHGKEYAKQNRNNKKLLGNIIDFYVRNTKEQQTLGLPVGPDTSLIISEILGTRIDMMIEEKISNLKGFRYIDDIYLYFKDLGQAENAKYILNSIFAEFELEMNMDKTEIRELHNEVEPEWVSELRFHEIKRNSEKDVISYFSKVFKYLEMYPNEAIIKYAIKRVSQIEVNEDIWPIFEAFLLKSSLADGSCLESVLGILKKYYKKNYNLNFDTIKETMNYIIEYNCNYYNVYEVLWALWIILIFDLEIDRSVQNLLSTFDDPLVALLVLYLRENNKYDKGIDLKIWKNHMKADDLYSNYWILSYESYARKWLDSKNGKYYLGNKKFFHYLYKENVNFTLDHTAINNEYILRDKNKPYVAFSPILDNVELFEFGY